ncbi:hypothetical protein ACFL26_02410, partial [Patescibacteria group bacterium]
EAAVYGEFASELGHVIEALAKAAARDNPPPDDDNGPPADAGDRGDGVKDDFGVVFDDDDGK